LKHDVFYVVHLTFYSLALVSWQTVGLAGCCFAYTWAVGYKKITLWISFWL